MQRALYSWLVVLALVVAGCGGSPALRNPTPSPVPAASVLPGLGIGIGLGPTASGGITALPPAAGQGGAPAWVQPGTRLVFYGRTASIVRSGYTYVEDEGGDWVDPQTGKHYRRTDQGDSPEDMPSSAAQAFTTTDVLAVDASNVVLQNTLYSLDLLANQFTLNPLGGGPTPGAAVDGGWVNPTVLNQAVTSGYQGMQILRGPYVLGGTQYDAVSFISRSEGGAYSASSFDAASGVLLGTTSIVPAAGAPVHGPLDDPQGNVQSTIIRFVGVRQRTIPGLTADAPGWVATTTTLTYQGTYLQVNKEDPSGSSWSWPLAQTVTFGDGGASWRMFTTDTAVTINGSQQSSQAAGVTSGAGLYWYDPASLAGFSVGDILDEDPILSIRTVVAAVDETPSGETVTIASEMNGVSTRLVYSRGNGILLSVEVAQSVTGVTISLQLSNG